MKSKKIYIETLGCPKNYVDSEFLGHHLRIKNNIIVSSPESADTILINTCGFIQPAKEESIDYILQYSKMNKEIIVMGCLVNRYKKELQKDIPEVKNFYTIQEAFERFANVKYNKYLNYSQRYFFDDKNYKYVKISEGCNHKCSFCTIPQIKGRLFSRYIKDILAEIKILTAQGIDEIILTSQDLINFGIDNNESLLKLLKNIELINESFKVRLLYLFPDIRLLDISKFIVESKKIIHYLDIPLQHVDNTILNKMKRPDDIKFYYKLINKIRKIIPDVVLRSTFIIGFPGETEQAFNELKKFLQDMRLNWVGFYKYSDEENTESFKLSNKISDDIIDKRIQEIVYIQKEITSKWLQHRVGKIYDFYVDDFIETDNIILGRSEFETPDIDGNIIITGTKKDIKNKKVKITGALDYDMEGILI